MTITGNPTVDRVIRGRAGRRRTYTQRMLALFGASAIIGLWPLGEASGTTCYDVSGHARNGTYTGVQLAQPGADRFTSAKYDGATSYTNVYGASLAGAFSGAAGTLGGFMRMSSAGIWSDGQIHRIFYLYVDGSNSVRCSKNISARTINFQHNASGVPSTFDYVLPSATTDWFHVAMTWSKSDDALIGYINGIKVGVTITGLGNFVGALTAATIGAAPGPAAIWSGWMQYTMVLNRAATASEVAQMARAV